MINRGGPTLVARIADQTGASPAAIATAFAAVRDSYDMPAFNDAINTLDGKVSGKTQLSLYASVQNLLLDRLIWFLRNADLSQGLAALVERHRAAITALSGAIDTVLTPQAAAAREARVKTFTDAGVPEALARRVADIPVVAVAPDVLMISERTQQPIVAVARTYFAAEEFFRMGTIAAAARQIAVSDYFDRLALDRALDSIGDAERRLAAAMIATGESGAAAVEAWLKPRKADVDRIRGSIQQIASSGLTLSKLSVAASLLGDLAKG
jgi:glutamate dehydrogenase